GHLRSSGRARSARAIATERRARSSRHREVRDAPVLHRRHVRRPCPPPQWPEDRPMIVSDATMRALHASLTGLNLRRQAAEDNIANIETPGYQASVVAFEDSLRTAIDRDDPASMTPTVTRSLAPTRPNGNNVQIDQEL